MIDGERRRPHRRGGPGAVPPILATWRANEPAAMTLISEQDFAVMPSGGWGLFAGATQVDDATAPRSPSKVMNVTYPASTAGGNSEGFTEKDLGATPFRTLYMCAWMKFSPNWQGASNGVNKMGFGYIGAGGGNNRLVFEAGGVGSGPLNPRIDLQGLVAGGNFDAGLTGQYVGNIAPTAFRRGSWDLLEMIAVANTTGALDGSVDLFLNGIRTAACSGIEWVVDASPKWNNFQINCLWGSPADTVDPINTGDMYMRCDHVYLSGK